MLKGLTKQGELKDVIINEDGSIRVEISDGKALETTNTSDRETVIKSNVLTIGTEITEININKKVTSIMVANYSETADVSLTAGGNTYQIGANLALELPVNIEVENLTITSTEAATKIQLVVKGVE